VVAFSLSPAERAQVLLLRALRALPAVAKRALAGAPTRVDGQELDLDVQVLLRLLRLAPQPPKSSMTPDMARERMRRSTAVLAGTPPLVEKIEELELPGPIGARLYTPYRAETGEARPLLVYLHGGGWVSGDLDTHDVPCRLLAAEGGVLVLSVDYRRAPEHGFPAAVEDALGAFGWAHEHAADLGADPGRVAVGGDSAGGNLAAVVSRLARDGDGPVPAMQLLIYPVIDLSVKHPSYRRFAEGFYLEEADMDWYRDHYLPGDHAVNDARASPLLADDLAGLPPAYIATAGFDPLRDEGEAYAVALRAAGVPAAVRRHPGLIHGFANLTAFLPAARAAMLEAAGALRMGLAPASAQPGNDQ
jgi:acetyl esterase